MKPALKKRFGIVLIGTALICALTVTIAALVTGEKFQVDGMTYTVLTDGTVRLSECPTGQTKLTIPSEVQWDGVTYTVTKIDGVLSDGDNSLKNIVFEEDCQITEITESFQGCTALESLTIPKSVKVIGKKAFRNCINLSSLTFEEGSELNEIGKEAFAYTGKDDDTVPAAIDSLTLPASLETLGKSVFHCIPVKYFALEDGSKLKKIPDGFLSADGDNGNPGVNTETSILVQIIEEGIEKFINIEIHTPKQVAEACDCLVSIDFGENNSLTYIGEGAFKNQTHLTGIDFGKDSTANLVISEGAFVAAGNSAGIETLVLPANLIEMGGSAFAYARIKNLVFSDNCMLEEIGCGFMEVYGIGNNGRPGMKGTASFEKDPVQIAANSLETVDFGKNNSLTTIGNGAFKNQSHMTAIDFGTSTADLTICGGAFVGVGNNGYLYQNDVDEELKEGIETLIFPASLISMEYGAFSEACIKNIVFSDNCKLKEIPSHFMGLSNYGNNGRPGMKGDASFEKDPVQIAANSLETVDFGKNNSLTTIGQGAFYNQSHMTAIDFGTSTAELTIRGGAFVGVGNNGYLYQNKIDKELREGIETLIFPANLIYIEHGAFSEACIKNIVFSDNCKLKGIPQHFMGIIGVGNNGYPGKDWDRNSETMEFEYLFIRDMVQIAANSLETIDFGENNSLTTIGNGAFYNQSHLKSINFGTSTAELTIQSGVFIGAGNNGYLYDMDIDDELNEGIETLVFPANLVALENGSFEFASIENIVFSDNCKLKIIPDNFMGPINIGNNGHPGQDWGVVVDNAEPEPDVYGHIFVKDSAQILANSLETVDFGENNSLTTINSGAFKNQSHMKSIDFGTAAEGVELSIGNGAFIGAGNNAYLVEQSIDSELNEGITTLVFPAHLAKMEHGSFDYARIRNIVFRDGCRMTEFPYGFLEVSGENGTPGTEVVVAATNCLESVDFGENNSLTAIGYGAFKNQTNLKSINFGTNAALKTLSPGAFIGLKSLESLDLSGTKIEYIRNGAFSYCGAAEIILPETLKDVNDGAFQHLTGMSVLVIDDSWPLTKLEGGVFSHSESLVMVNLLNSSITTIGDSLKDNANLTHIIFPENLESIEWNYSNTPKNLKSIEWKYSNTDDEEAKAEKCPFYGCDNLDSMYFASADPSVYKFDEGVFQFLKEPVRVFVPQETTDEAMEEYMALFRDSGVSFEEEAWTVERVIAVESVELDRNEAELEVGESITLTAAVSPENASEPGVIWSSSNINVAIVEQNGKVTAVGCGTAVITVTTLDGKLTASCTVHGKTPIYSNTVLPSENGTVSVDTESSPAGETVTITVKPNEGYTVDELIITDKDGNPVKVTENEDGTYSYVQPEGGVTIEVEFKVHEETKPEEDDDNEASQRFHQSLMLLFSQEFEIIAEASEGGSITPEGTSTLKYDRTVTYTITADEGYEISAVLVDGQDVGTVSEYTFKRVKADHTIEAIFEKVIIKEQNPFTDVKETDWFYEDVQFVSENSLMNGVGADQFAPDSALTRAMLVTVLWRLEGEPVVNYILPFSDIANGEWYTEAVRWAAAEGIVNGYEDSTFRYGSEITREQVMAILHRYAAYRGLESGMMFPMIPQYNCSLWAENDIIWADMVGLTDGIGKDIFDMTASADRAEIAAYLRRFCIAFEAE